MTTASPDSGTAARHAPEQGLAAMLHELSQPLNVIRLAAEGALLAIERGKADPAWQEGQFAVIAEQSALMAEIIDAVRLLCRRDSGRETSTADMLAGSHVMIVATDPSTVALADPIAGLGCRVSIAATGQDGQARFDRDPADIVLIDPALPTGDGAALIDSLRDIDPLLPLLIIAPRCTTSPAWTERFGDDRCAVFEPPPSWAEIRGRIAEFLRPPQG